jgi:hypothetical protein
MDEFKVNKMKNAFWLYLEEEAKKANKEFKPSDEHLKLIAFLFNHTFFITDGSLNLRKSWWLWGAPGLGKTFLVDCLAGFAEKVHFRQQFKVVGADYLAWEIKSGRLSAKEYINKAYLVIDHVDLESVQKEMGVWKMFLRERYEMYKGGARTCFISNYPLHGQEVCFSKLFDQSILWKLEDFLVEVYMPKKPLLI